MHDVYVHPAVWETCIHTIPRWHTHAVHEPTGHQCWVDDCVRPDRAGAEELLFQNIERVCDQLNISFITSEWLIIHTVPLSQN